jgi:predicted GH43/DUF377 family glycosyl hydrolase
MELLLFLATLAALLTTGLVIYGGIVLLRSSDVARSRVAQLAQALGLVRADENPIIEPGEHAWEAAGVFNPAAIEDGGRIHLFYRAIGSDGLSRIGYASSSDGKRFERLPYPVFAVAGPSSGSDDLRRKRLALHPGLIASGGSWGGVEDPRAVVIDDTLYLTFTAFEGWNSLRMGLTTIAMDDFRNQRWRWTDPIYLSKPGEVHKNWVLFPEKIGGRFAILHSLHSGSRDRVLVDYVDDLTAESDTYIESPYRPVKDPEAWDTTLRGAGPPPIRTEHGWLVLYHATDQREPSKYKIGALLLDLEDPSRVLARSAAPLLEPVTRYENERGKAGVVYASGATVRGDTLTVYYGGADYVVCVARHSLAKLMGALLNPRGTTAPAIM